MIYNFRSLTCCFCCFYAHLPEPFAPLGSDFMVSHSSNHSVHKSFSFISIHPHLITMRGHNLLGWHKLPPSLDLFFFFQRKDQNATCDPHSEVAVSFDKYAVFSCQQKDIHELGLFQMTPLFIRVSKTFHLFINETAN